MRARRADGGVDGAELAEAAAGSAARGTRPDAEDNRRRLCGRLSASVVITGAGAPFADAGRCQGRLTADGASGEKLSAATAAASSGDGADGGDTGAIGDERAECTSAVGHSMLGVQGSGMSGSPSSPAAAAVCDGKASGASSSDAAAAAPAPSAAVDIIAMTLRGE